MRIAVFFGGQSVEHEISIITACQVMSALSVNYTVFPIYISKNNKFYYKNTFNDLETFKNINKYLKSSNEVTILKKNKKNCIKTKAFKKNKFFDLAFPIVHGKGMEDGTLLSYLKLLKIPCVSDSAIFYSLAQNKTLTKRILNSLNIANAPFVSLKEYQDISSVEELKYPLIIKPNSLGSSIGIVKANNKQELIEGINEVFKYDRVALIEEFINDSKEYNISVVQKQDEILVSEIEEVVKNSDILSYKQKYEGGQKIKGMASSKRVFPADINSKIKEEIEETAKRIYLNMEAKGVIRIDFLYKDKLYVNEVNAIPGSYSYYLWKDKLDFVELLDLVIEDSKREYYKNNKLIKCIDKMTIFNKYQNSNSKLK